MQVDLLFSQFVVKEKISEKVNLNNVSNYSLNKLENIEQYFFNDNDLLACQDLSLLTQEIKLGIDYVANDVYAVNLNNYKFNLDRLWVTKPVRHILDDHIHPGYHISGVVYVNKSVDKKSSIKFHSSDYNTSEKFRHSEFCDVLVDHNIFNSNIIEYDVEIGTMYLFPSWLRHQAINLEEDKKRLSIAFNSSMTRK